MQILGLGIIHDFKNKHSDARGQIESWYYEVKEANWQTPTDIKKRFASASFLSDKIVIFNIKGNSYRLEVKVSFQRKKVIILWAGTHAEYDKRNKSR